MARFVLEDTGETWCPPVEATIGRSRLCTLFLGSPDISNAHASLRWRGGWWELKDLGSRNGTYISGERIKPGATCGLESDAVIQFGATERLTVENLDPPPPMAQRLDSGEWVFGSGRMLPLPDEQTPVLSVVSGAQGQWSSESDQDAREVKHGDVVQADGATWQLYLPQDSSLVTEAKRQALSIATSKFLFDVSRDGESIRLVIDTPLAQVDLDVRAHHEVALLLAREREKDSDNGLPAADQGWVYHDELAKMLRTERSHVNVAIYRLRKQLGEADFEDAVEVIERRRQSGQLRLGTANITFKRA